MARITQQTKEETRASILKEAFQLFSDLGYSETNTKTIAQRCHIAEGTIFNYFETKDDIMMAVFDDLSNRPEALELSTSIHPSDIIIDILIVPLRKLNRIPKHFIVDIMISAMKLSKKNNTLLQRLLALDMTYVAKAEDRMNNLLSFNSTSMNAKLLSEILYATLATEYLLYIFNESFTYNDFENSVKTKLHALINPYYTQSAPEKKEGLS